MNRPRRVLPVIFAGALLLSACGDDEDTSSEASVSGDFPLTVEDCGRKFTIEEQPQRILTMGSTASTLMWAAGATDAITTRAYESVSELGPAEAALATSR